MEVCSSSSCYMKIQRAEACYTLGTLERLPPPLLCVCHSLPGGLSIPQLFLTILLWEMLQQNLWGYLFVFNWKYKFSIENVFKFHFLTLKCSTLPSGTQNCSMPVSGRLDLIFLVSLNNISLKWPEIFLASFAFMEFNIKLHFSVWCSGFGAPKRFHPKVKTTICEKSWKLIIWIWKWKYHYLEKAEELFLFLLKSSYSLISIFCNSEFSHWVIL